MADPLDPAPAHADAFARAFPAIADRLAQIGPDPDLERLVEGFTELAKRVERVIDATSLRSVGHFAELLSPELLRPFPAATILELTPLGARRATREDFPAGAEFESISLDGTQCRFRAHAPFTFVPWRVSDAKTAWSGSRRRREPEREPAREREGRASMLTRSTSGSRRSVRPDRARARSRAPAPLPRRAGVRRSSSSPGSTRTSSTSSSRSTVA